MPAVRDAQSLDGWRQGGILVELSARARQHEAEVRQMARGSGLGSFFLVGFILGRARNLLADLVANLACV